MKKKPLKAVVKKSKNFSDKNKKKSSKVNAINAKSSIKLNKKNTTTKKASNNKKDIKVSNLNNSFKFQIKPFHIVYLLIILVFSASFLMDPAKSEDDDGGCSCDSCSCDSCDACGCNKDDDADSSEPEEDKIPSYTESNEALVAAQNAKKESCTDNVHFQSAIAGEIFTYTYSIQKCNEASVQVYLRKNNNEKIVLENPTYLNKNKALSGSGTRPSKEGYKNICVEIDGTPECR
jgi:hypothetical protein